MVTPHKQLRKIKNEQTLYTDVCLYCNEKRIFGSKTAYHRFEFVCIKCDLDRYVNDYLNYKKVSARKRWASGVRKKANRRRPMKYFPRCQICNKPRQCIHHIKPISSFKMGTPARIINIDDNLMVLCKKCHKDEHQILLG